MFALVGIVVLMACSNLSWADRTSSFPPPRPSPSAKTVDASSTKHRVELQSLLDRYNEAAGDGDKPSKDRWGTLIQKNLVDWHLKIDGEDPKSFTAVDFYRRLDRHRIFPKTAAIIGSKLRGALQVCSMIAALCVNAEDMQTNGQFDLPGAEDFRVETPTAPSSSR